MARLRSLIPLFVLAACGGGASEPSPGGGPPPVGADLSGFATTRALVGGVEFELWLAQTPAQRAQGLMNATADQLADLPDGTPRGMLFIFSSESFLSFWMRNTFVPLDLAYATADGTIVEIHEMIPLNETPVTASQPVRYALETARGTLALHAITPTSLIDVP